jgi:hypothetical protein
MTEMTKIRNGRAVINGKVKDIMLPEQETYVFDFSRYKSIIIEPYFGEKGVEKVVCKNAKTEILPGSKGLTREEKGFWQRAVGFETGNSYDQATEDYRLVNRDFDILQGADLVYAHKDLEDILTQLKASSITPFFRPSLFGLRTTGETIQMEVAQMKSTTGRTATFEKPVIIDGQPYLLEVKGVNFGEKPIDPRQNYYDGGECAGGLTVARMNNSVDILRKLNANGYDSVVLVAAYKIPLKQFDGQELGAYIRAVKSSPPLSHYDENLRDAAEALGMSNEEFAEYIIRSAARDMAIIWKLGITHGWVHEQNIRIGGVSDLTGAHYVRESGFNGVATDAEMLIATSQKIMRKLVGPKEMEYPPDEMYEKDQEKAKRLERLADESEYKDQAKLYCMTREIITTELNRQLGLGLPPVIGTTTLAAEVYAMQRSLGFTNPKEKLHIEHYKGHKNGKGAFIPLTLDDIRVPK